MVTLKQFLARFFFSLEILVFMLFYIFGQNGLIIIYNNRKNNQAVISEISVLNKQVQELTLKRDKFKTDDFYKEDLARNLQMAYPNEDIYPI